jgi:hypothetical protein
MAFPIWFFPVWNKIAEGKDKIWEHAKPQQKNQDFFEYFLLIFECQDLSAHKKDRNINT